MYKYIFTISFLFLFGFFACIEKYDFRVTDKSEGIVIEASISNQSFYNTLSYPADGRYFKVEISKTSDVINIRDVKISNAIVKLFDDNGGEWFYTADQEKAGDYYLHYPEFKAMAGRKYKLQVSLTSGDYFESSWESLPSIKTELGELEFRERKLDKYIWRNSEEKVLTSFDAIDVFIRIRKNENNETKYYRWSYEPIWLYTAPETDPKSPYRTCWIRSPFYLKKYILQVDQVGDYDKKLFHIETTGNERIYEYFSVLITQTELSEAYYYFWEDLQAQNEKGGLFDQAPFNLSTNFKAVNNDRPVNGYFGVVTEKATRWVFDKEDLSYGVVDDIVALCKIDYGPAAGPTDCDNCLYYTQGDAVNVPPWWW